MTVLHGTWVPDETEPAGGWFFVWGESATSSSRRSSPRRASRDISPLNPSYRQPGPRSFPATHEPGGSAFGRTLIGETGLPKHPFQADPMELLACLSGFSWMLSSTGLENKTRIPGSDVRFDLFEKDAASRHLGIMLPSFLDRPEASPEFIPETSDHGGFDGYGRDGGGDGGKEHDRESGGDRPTGERHGDGAGNPSLAPWEVTGVSLLPPDALVFLSLLTGPEGSTLAANGNFSGFRLGSVLVLGADLRFWSQAAKFALELLVRQRFMPGLRPRRRRNSKKAELHAIWRPLLADPEDLNRFRLLAESIPGLCRALIPPEGERVTLFPSPGCALVSGFLDVITDGTIRRWLSDTGAHGGATPRSKASFAEFSIAEKWFQALSRSDSVVRGTSREQKLLDGDIRAWASEIEAPADSAAFRTCFRLDPPSAAAGGEERSPANQDDWTLRFFLQAVDDPSLLIPAETVWGESKSTLDFLNKRFEHPQERLLADLWRAAKLYPPIEESLVSATPRECRLTTTQAYQFLREGASLLEESGFGILVPHWWERAGEGGPRLGVRLTLRPGDRRQPGDGKGALGLGALVDYDWQVALGDQPISPGEFEKLAALKVPLVRIRGQWVELRPDRVDAVMRFWEKRGDRRKITLRDALRLTLDQTGADADTGEGVPILGVDASGWIAELSLTLREGGAQKLSELAPPKGFCGRLRPYQVKGFSWLRFMQRWGLGACLADDMGLGKTVQLIALVLHNLENCYSCGPVLLICPTSVVGNWERELARFGPSLRVLIHHGAERFTGKALADQASNHHLLITTYSLAHRDEEHLATVEWGGVVLDEAQNIKNPFTKQAQSIRRLSSGYRVALTGTPVENNLSELWSIMDFLNPGYLGGSLEFRSRFAVPIERYQDSKALTRLRRLVQPFILRRLKTDPLVIRDLPKKQEIKVFCTLTREQATLYEAVVRDMMDQIETSTGIQRRGIVLATLAKLKQVCNHPAHFLGDGSELGGRSGKMARLVEMLEEVLAEGDTALVFTQFAQMGVLLRNHLRNTFAREVLFLHGGVPQEARDRMVARFQADDAGAPPLFVLSLKAGGVGLNLTRANHVFHFDRWWNPAVENQATDRVFRIGQRRNVQIHKFICIGTLEERIDHMIESKKELAENIVGSGEGWLTEMSASELREVLALRQDAVRDEL